MNSEERFKKSLEELVNSKAFPFDEGNWEKAREIIDAAKKPRRIAPFILGGILLLGTLVTGTYFMSDIFSAPTKKLAVNSNKETRQVITPEKMHTLLKAEKPESVARASEIASTSPFPKDLVSSRALPAKTIPNTPPVVMKDAVIDISAAPVKPSKTKNNFTAKGPEITSPEKNPEIPTAVSSSPTKINSDQTADKTDNVVSNFQKEITPTSVAEPTSKVISEPLTPVKVNEPTVDLAEIVDPPANTTNNSSEQHTTAIDESYAPTKINITNDATKEVSAPIVMTDSLKPVDLDELPADNDQGELGKPKDYPVLFSVEAGANYMYGWQNPGTRDASGFNPVIGVNYFNNFKPKMSLTFGIQYTSVSKLNYSTYTSRVSRFAFGEENNVTVFTPVKLHYLIVPLRFNYSLNVMNSVGIGCNIAYLLNVESDVETYTEKLNAKSNQVLSKTTGYTEGFKKYDTQISAFYKRRLYPNLALNVEMFYGFTDIKDNTLFKSNVFERNTGVKLTLVYNFLKK